MVQPYDALLVVSFGGPEGPDDVMPFLENVLRGKNVPRQRMLEVAEHYQHFGGVSPINAQNRELIAALQTLLDEQGPHLPIYWGNRNWHPLLVDTIRQMARDGIRRSLAFVTSAFSSYSGCRQYREDIQRACQQVGPSAPAIDKLRVFFNHPGFIQAVVDSIKDARRQLPAPQSQGTPIVFTAHSLPLAMAETSNYESQLRQACGLVAEALGNPPWQLAYQSRSGPPSQPWLEPDICDVLEKLAHEGDIETVIVQPIGFLSDHMEVLFDLDTEAKALCDQRGLKMIRAKTVGTHPAFMQMIRQLILERTSDAPRQSVGDLPAGHDICPTDCCLPPPRPGR
ncbi:MAG: ferrochelatase [Planctomycetales bacterium]|nr:ferrochelatase [Planctomycetales bacterium]NIM09501.1 ferrochelatase [Planctomycetales bacterium]NIN08989.1 ferrochelatase [Planctomycetales bacterium]NIN78104.1 ferrochelatase [Planctomycetales bacterium]NIO35284.1 ferrochelatase [Planctomycetales bacterium]